MLLELYYRKVVYRMSDSSMDYIKSGKGLPPLNSSSNRSSTSGPTTEQRAGDGILKTNFTYQGEKKDNKK